MPDFYFGPEVKERQEFTLAIKGGSDFKELLEAGKCSRKLVPKKWAEIELPKEDSRVKLTLISFARLTVSEQVKLAAGCLGLRAPEPYHALFFGAEYPKEQLKGRIAFLHTPFVSQLGDEWVWVLSSVRYRKIFRECAKRTLAGRVADHEWPRGYRFAFVSSDPL